MRHVYLTVLLSLFGIAGLYSGYQMAIYFFSDTLEAQGAAIDKGVRGFVAMVVFYLLWSPVYLYGKSKQKE